MECKNKMNSEIDPVRRQSFSKNYLSFLDKAAAAKKFSSYDRHIQNQQSSSAVYINSGYGIYNNTSSNPYQIGYCGSPSTNRGGCCATAVW
jgi:hypothetical protein